MAKNSNGWTTKIKVFSGIVVLLVVFAGLVTGFGNIGDNSKAIDKHVIEDKDRDKAAAEETNKLENAVIAIEKDITYIKEGMVRQETVSEKRDTEQKAMLKGISDEIKAIHRSP